MVELKKSELAIARIERRGKKFEIIVDPELAFQFKEGKISDIMEVLISDAVYRDAKKGLEASSQEMMEAFSTDDPLKVAEIIIKKGVLPTTAEQRREQLEAKRREIIDFITKNCINPQTGLPHPPQRIEKALKEAKVPIDLNKPVEEQVLFIIRKISPIIPIRYEKAMLTVKIPPQYAPKAYGLIERAAEIKRQEWKNDGSWVATIEIPAGLQGSLIEELNKLTRGQVQIKTE